MDVTCTKICLQCGAETIFCDETVCWICEACGMMWIAKNADEGVRWYKKKPEDLWGKVKESCLPVFGEMQEA